MECQRVWREITCSPTTRKEDLKLVRCVLKTWQRFAYDNRWGGLHTEWEECKQATEALEQIEAALVDRQMELPGLATREREHNLTPAGREEHASGWC